MLAGGAGNGADTRRTALSGAGASCAGLRPERDPCREHPEEEVNYFCFDCQCPPICSECVIHGIH